MLCDLKYNLFWRSFHGLLRKMYTVLLRNKKLKYILIVQIFPCNGEEWVCLSSMTAQEFPSEL
jgi:hypothetical protein